MAIKTADVFSTVTPIDFMNKIFVDYNISLLYHYA